MSLDSDNTASIIIMNIIQNDNSLSADPVLTRAKSKYNSQNY